MSDHASCHFQLFDIYCSEEKKGQMQQICISASWHFFLSMLSQIIALGLILREGQGSRERERGRGEWGGKSFFNAFLTLPAHHDAGIFSKLLSCSQWLRLSSRCVSTRRLEHEGKAEAMERENMHGFHDLLSMTYGHTSWNRLNYLAPTLPFCMALCTLSFSSQRRLLCFSLQSSCPRLDTSLPSRSKQDYVE